MRSERISITCDYCKKELHCQPPHYLELDIVNNPFNTASGPIYRPIEAKQHFCGLDCLKHGVTMIEKHNPPPPLFIKKENWTPQPIIKVKPLTYKRFIEEACSKLRKGLTKAQLQTPFPK